jgi:hypothetical protein
MAGTCANVNVFENIINIKVDEHVSSGIILDYFI